MAGRGYTIFDTAIGRCGIAWGDLGVVGVQLPEVREIDTRKRLFHLYPEAREIRPPVNVEAAIEGIAMLLRGGVSDLSDVTLDMTGIPAFNQRVYAFARSIPRGEIPHLCRRRVSLAGVGGDPFGGAGYRPQPLHDHRALPSRARGRTLRRQYLAERRGHLKAKATVDRGHPPDHEPDPVRRAASRCAAAGA